MAWSIFLMLMGLAIALAAGEVLVLVGGAYYGVRAAIAYKDCMRATASRRRMSPGRRFKYTQRLYWQYVKAPRQPPQLTEAQRWLQAQTGMRLSLLEVLKHIVAIIAAVLVWPAAMLAHVITLLPAAVAQMRERSA